MGQGEDRRCCVHLENRSVSIYGTSLGKKVPGCDVGGKKELCLGSCWEEGGVHKASSDHTGLNLISSRQSGKCHFLIK